MSNSRTYSATEFKAKCLDILDRLAAHELVEVTVTKRGKAVAVLHPPSENVPHPEALHGFMRGMALIGPDLDLTEPVLSELPLAAQGRLHE